MKQQPQASATALFQNRIHKIFRIKISENESVYFSENSKSNFVHSVNSV